MEITFSKALTCRIHMHRFRAPLTQKQDKRQVNPIFKRANDLNRRVFKENMQMSRKYMKGSSVLSAIQGYAYFLIDELCNGDKHIRK